MVTTSTGTSLPGGDGRDFRWPPPGLERVQGDLWRVATSGALAGALMVVPVLVAVASGSSFASLGPFADAWWIALVVSAAGLAFALDAFVCLARLFRRASRAVERGYDGRTVVHVACDAARDTGFLLRAARHFSAMEPRERSAVLSLRVLTPTLFVIAGVWLSVVLAVGLFMAARGWMEPDTLWRVTLLPAGFLYAFGAVTWATEEHRVRRARRAWYDRAWSDDLDPARIEAWRTDAGARGEPVGPRPVVLRRVAVLILALTLIVSLPVLGLLSTSAVGPLLTAVSMPPVEPLQRRAAVHEAYRPLGVPTDPGVSATEAGRLLQNLAYVGSDRPAPPGELEPLLRIELPWLPEEAPGPFRAPLTQWPEGLFTWVAGGLDAEARAYLATVAGHRARADFSRLARAPRLDVASGRWEDPFPVSGLPSAAPVPRLSDFRTGVHAHLASAAHALAEGRADEAETLVREVVSVGFLLADDGPTLVDNLVGLSVVRDGAVALEGLYRATGRDALADRLVAAHEAAERAAERLPELPAGGVDAMLARLPTLILDTKVMRGLRWESFGLLSTLAPCANLNRIVFGPDPAYRDFVEEARRALIAWPSEEPFFERTARGLPERDAESGWAARVLSMPMRSGSGACEQLTQRIETLRALR